MIAQARPASRTVNKMSVVTRVVRSVATAAVVVAEALGVVAIVTAVPLLGQSQFDASTLYAD